MNYSVKSYTLLKNIDFVYSSKISCFFVKCFSGIFMLRLPSYYFFNILKSQNKIILLFLKNFFFKSFLNHLFSLSNRISIVYFIKLRIRGLGFRMRSINDVIYYFFFNYTIIIIYIVLKHY